MKPVESENVMVVQTTASALGRLGEPAVKVLVAALSHKNPDARRSAAQALGKIKDIRATEPLVTALNDEDWSVRLSAADALGEIKATYAIEPLKALLGDKKARVRQAAREALKKMGGKPK